MATALTLYSGQDTEAVILAKTDIGLDGEYWLADDTHKIYKGKVVSGELTWIDILDLNQFAIEEGKVYSVKRWGDQFARLGFSMFSRGAGYIKIYTSQIDDPADKTEMQLEHENVIGHRTFKVIPKYILIEIESGTIEEVILTGIEPIEI